MILPVPPHPDGESTDERKQDSVLASQMRHLWLLRTNVTGLRVPRADSVQKSSRFVPRVTSDSRVWWQMPFLALAFPDCKITLICRRKCSTDSSRLRLGL
ncbi:hypothetical protein Dda_4003 [Drechslerella dactyloides]|uniref:Uncharacterized protein n=1 Tax=Drechslerella dactyloides TaxID=74499 RepID=A0AAD6J0G4_DREDA|nr:hypothetical protein Dda_4003 [Drechslerella dactyloides]